MVFTKVFDREGRFKGTEKLEMPVYVRQSGNGMFRCMKYNADGFLSADASEVYQFDGRSILESTNYTAQIISAAEYEELIGQT